MLIDMQVPEVMMLLFVGGAVGLVVRTWQVLRRDLPRMAVAVGPDLISAATSTSLHLAGLAAVASVAPFVGLAGTLWHMMDALSGMQGQTEVSALARPLGSALRYTFYGIMAAIPAVAAHALLARRLATALDLAEARAVRGAGR